MIPANQGGRGRGRSRGSGLNYAIRGQGHLLAAEGHAPGVEGQGPRGRGRGYPARGQRSSTGPGQREAVTVAELRALSDPGTSPTQLVTTLASGARRLAALCNDSLEPNVLEHVIRAVGTFCHNGGLTMHSETFLDVVKILESKAVFRKVDQVVLHLAQVNHPSGKAGPTPAERLERLILGFSRIVQDMLVLLPAFTCNSLGQKYFDNLLYMMGMPSVRSMNLPQSCLDALRQADYLLRQQFENMGPENAEVKNQAEASALRMEAQDEMAVLQKPPESFRRLDIIPKAEDILVDYEPFIRPNITRYPDAETYLDIHFRLLREDLFYPLRAGIRTYRDLKAKRRLGHKADNMRLYFRVRIVEVDATKSSMTLQFAIPGTRKIDWTTSKRLMYGSLLCLSPDDFKTILLFTVDKRNPEELAKGRIAVKFQGVSLPVDALRPEYVMAESPVYFESYRGVLEALKGMSAANFPMAPFILGQTSAPVQPNYLKQLMEETGEVVYNLRPLLEPLVTGSKAAPATSSEQTEVAALNTRQKLAVSRVILNVPDLWPSHDDLNLDASQSAALRAALTQNVAIIQGPPGTGKTYVGLRIVQALLHNKSAWWDRNSPTPILVVCFTNHALDQFLEGILKYTKQIVRIGGQSKTEALKDYSLFEWRKKAVQSRIIPKDLFVWKRQVAEEMKNHLGIIEEIKKQLGGLRFYSVVHEDTLLNHGIIPDSFIRKLQQVTPPNYRESGLRHWLQIDSEEQLTFLVQRNRHYRVLRQTPPPNVDRIPGPVAPEGNPEAAGNDGNVEEEGWDPEDIREIERERVMEDEDAQIDGVGHARVEEEVVVDLRFKYAFKTSEFYRERVNLQEKIKSLMKSMAEVEPEERNLIAEDLQWTQFRIRQLEHHERLFVEVLQNPPANQRVGEEELNRLEDADWRQIPLPQRWLVYFHWRDRLVEALEGNLKEVSERYEKNLREHRDAQSAEDAFHCKRAMVVGMTTSGAAKQRALLEHLMPKIVVVEEAAEVLEAHVTTSLSSKCEHLILIGDHQQLRPTTAVYHLAREYRLEVSMFERLIQCGFQPCVLGVQHRMRPEIARLIVPSIYKTLENHPSVYRYPEILGVEESVFFLTHLKYEIEDHDGKSHLNPHEAEMALKLASHLILQGYSPQDITILTTYTGQFLHMKKLRRSQFSSTRDVRICVLDNFQGEENDIIILSLVRSNQDENIGFLRTENRICVALSRAKHGFYLLGNMDILGVKSKLWAGIRRTLENHGQIGSLLRLKCQVHEDVTEVSAPVDFPPEGGCQQLCLTVMPCGHVCRRICHARDRPHAEQTCREKCDRQCEEGHPCPKLCHQDCRPCLTGVERILPCGHLQSLKCHQDPRKACCVTKVVRTLPICEHEIELDCGQDVSKVSCPFKCDVVLDCGHVCQKKCHQRSSHENYRCQLPCARTPCPESHPCPKKCHEECGNCKEKLVKTLNCGHQAETECFRPTDEVYCRIPVRKTLPDCTHTAVLECGQPADAFQCKERCGKLLCVDEHVCRKLCHEKCGPCPAFVERKLPCAHVNRMRCADDPSAFKCREKVPRKLSSCGHSVELPCHANPEETACPRPCDVRLDCGHMCTRTCHVNDDPEHFKYECRKPCPRTKVGCRQNHKCSKVCSEECDPCNVKVKLNLPCGHKTTAPCRQDPETFFCKVEVEKAIPECGHEIRISCSQIPDRSLCTLPCNKRLTCGHQCRKRCCEPCDPRDCEELVEIDDKLSCGHAVRIKCGVIQQGAGDYLNDDNKERLLADCTAPCGQNLPCQHLCRGTCGQCFSGRVHMPCEQDCGRTLVCGHICEVKCASSCPPCSKKCENRCSHSRCGKKCSEPCSPCQEKCEWYCPHYRCTRTCSDYCDRPPCDAPCRKKLKCGHICVGLCGELCPPLCRVCNEDQLTEFTLYGNEEDPESRFVYLVDCGHSIEVEGMDHWMRMDQNEGRAVQMKCCPRCKTIIRTCSRYNDVLKQCYEDIALVKNRIVGARGNYRALVRDLRRQLKPVVIQLEKLQEEDIAGTCLLRLLDEVHIIAGKLTDRPAKKPNAPSIPPNLEVEERFLLPVKIQLLGEILSLLFPQQDSETPQLKVEFFDSFDQKCLKIVEALRLRTLRISEHEYRSLQAELDRLKLVRAFYGIKSSTHFPHPAQLAGHRDVKEAHDVLKKLLFDDVNPIDASSKTKIDENLRFLADRLKAGLGLSREERRQVVKAMAMGPGHWYKCPNGHFYAIGDCGGAMQESHCNECGAAIGGGSHRLLDDNQHAPEMDGSARAAWPPH